MHGPEQLSSHINTRVPTVKAGVLKPTLEIDLVFNKSKPLFATDLLPDILTSAHPHRAHWLRRVRQKSVMDPDKTPPAAGISKPAGKYERDTPPLRSEERKLTPFPGVWSESLSGEEDPHLVRWKAGARNALTGKSSSNAGGIGESPAENTQRIARKSEAPVARSSTQPSLTVTRQRRPKPISSSSSLRMPSLPEDAPLTITGTMSDKSVFSSASPRGGVLLPHSVSDTSFVPEWA